MQLICHQDITDYATWKSAFDADGEARRQAGLTVMQIWKGADSATHVVILMQVNDRARAQAWLDRSAALTGDDAGTVVQTTAHFVEVA